MDFQLTDEQKLLHESVRRLLARVSPFETRDKFMKSTEGFNQAAWHEFAEMGLLGLPFAEGDGGFGGGPVESMIVMEELGRALALEPYLGSIIVCGSLLKSGASAEHRKSLLTPMIAGKCILALAHAEPGSRYDLNVVATQARHETNGFVISGTKSLVFNGNAAHALITSARTAGNLDDREGISLFIVDPTSKGITRRDYQMQDGRRASTITFDQVVVDEQRILGRLDMALPLIERAIDDGIAALCAEAVGIMDETLAMTVEYLTTRKQFGVALGTFQSLQHRAADMYVALESARSMVYRAVMGMDEVDMSRRRAAMSAAKVQIGKSGRFIGQQAVQLHGGIGLTMEYRLGHLFKRLTAIEKTFGDTDYHIEQLARHARS